MKKTVQFVLKICTIRFADYNWLSRNTIDWNIIFTKCEDLDYNWLIRGKYLSEIDSADDTPEKFLYKKMLKEKDKEIAKLNREIGRLQHAVDHLKKGGTVAGFGVEVRTELDE